MLLVEKILKMKCLLSCTSRRWDLRRLRKYYRLEVQLANLVKFAHLLLRFASHFFALQVSLTLLWITFSKDTYTFILLHILLHIFLHSKLVLHCSESRSPRIRIHLFIFIWSCTSSWWDLKGLIKYYRPGSANILSWLRQNFLRFAPHLFFLL